MLRKFIRWLTDFDDNDVILSLWAIAGMIIAVPLVLFVESYFIKWSIVVFSIVILALVIIGDAHNVLENRRNKKDQP